MDDWSIAIAALVGIVAVFLITLSRSIDRYRSWRARQRRQARDRAVSRVLEARDRQVAEQLRRAHAAHPVVHRWPPNDRGAA